MQKIPVADRDLQEIASMQGVPYSQRTESVMPTEGKNFLQSAPVVSWLTVSTLATLAVPRSTAAPDIVECSASAVCVEPVSISAGAGAARPPLIELGSLTAAREGAPAAAGAATLLAVLFAGLE